MSCSIAGYVESKKRDKVLKRGMGIDFVSKLVFFFEFQKSCY